MSRRTDNVELRQRRGSYDENNMQEDKSTGTRRTTTFVEPVDGEYEPFTEDGSITSNTGLDKVTVIVKHMEKDDALMEDNPTAEQLRKEKLREMPQALTLKRCIKAKLSKSVSIKSQHKPLGFFKQFQYRLSMTFSKYQMAIKDLVASFELWYSALKSIEGYFGSGVASYFKFLRLMFITNLLICMPVISFMVVPQLIYNLDKETLTNITYTTCIDNSSKIIFFKPQEFEFENIFTGEGYLAYTTLYYGSYSNNTVTSIPHLTYNIPYAYFFTMVCIYVVTFLYFSARMAKSYKHSFIETSGGLKNVFAHKIFCGWDFSIATEDGAKLKSSSIYNELQELLSLSRDDPSKLTFKRTFWTFVIQVVCHLIILIVIAVIGYGMYELLILNREKKIVVSVVITLVMYFGPLIFSSVVRYEDYKNPKNALYVSLIRTFLLEIVVIGVLLYSWLSDGKKSSDCWETHFGQEIYRLILLDFLFTFLFIIFNEVLRKLVYKYLWKKIGEPEFDIARHTLQIIYNQTLFWIGLYFSPMLAIIVTIKYFITWYIKQYSCIYFCQPAKKSWRAAQTQTLFLVMNFFTLFLVIVVLGYVVTQVYTSRICGPFRDKCYAYQIITSSFQIEAQFLKVLLYLLKPGVITGVLIAIGVWVYYLREKSIAQRSMVIILQEMLQTEAKDKEFLLAQISQVTEGKWIYNLKRTYGRSKLYSEESSTWKFKSDLPPSEPSTSNHEPSRMVETNFPHSRNLDSGFYNEANTSEEGYEELLQSPDNMMYEREMADYPYEDFQDPYNPQELERRRQYQESPVMPDDLDNSEVFQRFQPYQGSRLDEPSTNVDKLSLKTDTTFQSFYEQENDLFKSQPYRPQPYMKYEQGRPEYNYIIPNYNVRDTDTNRNVRPEYAKPINNHRVNPVITTNNAHIPTNNKLKRNSSLLDSQGIVKSATSGKPFSYLSAGSQQNDVYNRYLISHLRDNNIGNSQNQRDPVPD